MKWRSLVLLLSFFMLLSDAAAQKPNSGLVVKAEVPPVSKPLSVSQQELCQKARLITIKVLSGDGTGSGILIYRNGRVYKVVTSAHVVRENKNNRIQTPDGKLHTVESIDTLDKDDSTGDDLAILQFRSSNNYPIARKLREALTSLKQEDEVFAAGFPFNANSSSKFECTQFGKVSHLLEKPMRLGYQVGYRIDIKKGMSGGPLLNIQGEVVGINGQHSYPLWGGNDSSNYLFKNGVPVPFPPNELSASSWAIPIETFARQTQASKFTIPVSPGRVSQKVSQSKSIIQKTESAIPSSQQPKPHLAVF
ncbi:S1 family peptidase [Floridanema evergladense]|uniref:Serine protease n=1 Tax=Floridaenema evergladense BLCC-F167 TaxID=3153639 RepID=A0ABV4WS38_9CYAN